MKFIIVSKIFIVFMQLMVTISSTAQNVNKNPVITIGEFEKIFDQSIGEKDKWYINDHCFIRADDGKWHMIGITGRDAPNPWDESNFAHAVADSLAGMWKKKKYALSVRNDLDETVLWAPHIVKANDMYYMFYCGGHADHRRYQINLATSSDLYEWKRYAGNPLLMDGYDARDPFIFRDAVNERWIMYYTATSKPEGGRRVVAAKVSNDLINWSQDRYVVFKDPVDKGTWGGNTESPVIIQRGDWYYLFIGPGASYKTTKVYRSRDPFNWDMEDEVAELEAHAAEIFQSNDKWYISHCGLKQGGLYLAPLTWHDDVEEKLKEK
ncbi:family 43 glycosylhydrolase [Niabella aquatica]